MDDDNLAGYVSLAMVLIGLLVLGGICMYLWIEAFLAGDRFVVFASGGGVVLFVNVAAWFVGRKFQIVRREKRP